MFGVRIVAFAAALLGLAAVVPLDLAEARPRYSNEGSYSKYLRTSYAKAHARKTYAKTSRKTYAKHGSRKSYSRQSTRKSYAHSASKRKTYAHRAVSSTRSARNSTAPIRVAASARASAGLGPRPARWCGWWMRTQLGGGPELNLARNWKHWGRPSGPQVGAVVVWSSHVGIITGRAANGQWIVKSGNDGGRVRERPRSVAGAVFRVA
jgi:hypothetical protein